jgi:hypothetical protein
MVLSSVGGTCYLDTLLKMKWISQYIMTRCFGRLGSLNRHKAGRLGNLFFKSSRSGANLGSPDPLWIRLVIMACRRATCATDTPDAHDLWQRRDLSTRRFVYIWADGVYFRPRTAAEKQFVLVLIGADEWGRMAVPSSAAA